MKPHTGKLKFFGACTCALWLGLAGQTSLEGQSAPASAAVTPAAPTILVGQTQQFSASGLTTAAAVSAGGEYTCVRFPDGTARCTGRNQFAQLANGAYDNSSVLTVSGLANATRVAAGDEFGCARMADGTASCWGLGESGQRGDGTFTQTSAVPVAVSGLTGASDVAAGYSHACALLLDGTLRCWGQNLFGQLGDPST